MGALKRILDRTSFQLGIKLLLVIVCTEAAIMAFYHLLGVSPASLWAGIADALMLGVISSWVIFTQVVKPLQQAGQQNDLFNTLVNNLDVGVVLTDPNQQDHPIIYVNPAFTRITGYSADEAIGNNPRFLQGDDVDEDAVRQTREAIEQKKSVRVLQRNRRKDGGQFWNDFFLNPIFNSTGHVQFWVGLVNDVSETKGMEEQLRQSQKMEAVGMLVGGIAHDFNNVLAGMLGNLYLVRSRLKGFPELTRRIESVEEQGYGAAGMVRQLLSFSRKDMPDIKTIDLVPFSKELFKFSHVSVPENIHFSCDIEQEGELIISCDPVQLQQSLLNLIVNATHAVHERYGDNGRGGNITLLSRHSEPPENKASYDDLAPATARQWACISVRDNGAGMDQATRERIFEPFFTTKPSGVGTGLGLAMVKGYVEALGGVIHVESDSGGTCMAIYLPLSQKKCNVTDAEHAQLRQGRGELILVADDDVYVLEALSSILESANYRLLTAANGEQAITMFNANIDELDMAILDMVMPKTSGLQAADHMTQQREHFPVTLMTGYDKQDSIISKKDCPYSVLRKPWDIFNLNRVISAALDNAVRDGSPSM